MSQMIEQRAAMSLKLLTIREASELLQISERTIWSFTHRGELPAVKLGRSIRYHPTDLNRFIENKKSAAGKCPAAS